VILNHLRHQKHQPSSMHARTARLRAYGPALNGLSKHIHGAAECSGECGRAFWSRCRRRRRGSSVGGDSRRACDENDMGAPLEIRRQAEARREAGTEEKLGGRRRLSRVGTGDGDGANSSSGLRGKSVGMKFRPRVTVNSSFHETFMPVLTA
jgi:hypothetical protein